MPICCPCHAGPLAGAAPEADSASALEGALQLQDEAMAALEEVQVGRSRTAGWGIGAVAQRGGQAGLVQMALATSAPRMTATQDARCWHVPDAVRQ